MEKRLNKILLIAIIGVVCFMSMGYSILNRELNITGELTYRPKADIRITNLTQGTIKDATIQYADYSKNVINFAYKATNTSATVALVVEITNFTDTEMGILKIDNLPANATITGYTLKDKLKNNTGPLTTGMSTTFTITFKATTTNSTPLTLNFDFEPFYKVEYQGFSSTNGYKMEVLKGENFSQNIGKSAEVCYVVMDYNVIDDYTIANGVIEIPNVSGDIVIDAFDPVVEAPTTPNPPELNGDMIPVRYMEGADETTGNWVKADVTNENNDWYDYANQKWANAVTIISDKRQEVKGYSAGTVIPMDYINTMWVWIPRYSYTIKSEDDGESYLGKRSSCLFPTKDYLGEIDVKFIPTSKNDTTGTAQYTENEATNWRTNEAFNFGGTARAGIWVGKFETTGTSSETCTNESCNVSGVTILPLQSPIRNKKLSNFFYMARSMQKNNAEVYGFNANSGDLHVIKNDEWGAVAYLSQSRYGKYGNSDYDGANKQVYINNMTSYITGYSGGAPDAYEEDDSYEYDDMTDLGLDDFDENLGKAGPGASTTGTVYGVYDMNGGAWEYVMGVLEYDSQTENAHPGVLATATSGFKGLNKSGSATGTIDLPDEKYYNIYRGVKPTATKWVDAKPELACDGGVCYGHALSETERWYKDYAFFIWRQCPWVVRGGYYGYSSISGVFAVDGSTGTSQGSIASRFAIV